MRKIDTYLKPRGKGNAPKKYQRLCQSPGWGNSAAATIIMLFLLIPSLATLTVLAAQPPTITVTTSTQTLIADQENTVEVTVTNTGDYNAVSTFMTVNLPSPGASGSLMILNGSDGRFFLGDLAPGENKTITLHIIVGKAAAGSLYPISFTFTYQYIGQVTDTRSIGFEVPTLEVLTPRLDLTLSPQNLIAGATNSLNLTLRNTGNGTASALSVLLTLPGTSYVLMGGDGTWYIDELKAGDEAVIPLQIYILPAAANSGATFTVTATFTDPQSRTAQQSNSFGVLSLGSVNLVILSSSTYPSKVSPGAPFSLTVTLLNVGSTTAQSMIFTPNGTSQVAPLSQNKIYLGDLTVNVPSSLTLPFIAGNITAGDFTLSIAYSYRNSLGMNMNGTLQVPFTLVLADNNSTGQEPTATPSPWGILLYALPIIAVVAIIAYLLYRRKSRSS